MLRAHDLSVAALIADDIYNFGELVRSLFAQLEMPTYHVI